MPWWWWFRRPVAQPAPVVSAWRWDASRAVWYMPGYPWAYSPALRAYVAYP